eukprot:4104888-Pleurochrysis_carterae.AAC.1
MVKLIGHHHVTVWERAHGHGTTDLAKLVAERAVPHWMLRLIHPLVGTLHSRKHCCTACCCPHYYPSKR